jgi:hypothetical protein
VIRLPSSLENALLIWIKKRYSFLCINRGAWKNRNFCGTHNCSLYAFCERTPLLLFCHWSFGIRLVGYSQIYNTHASAHPQTHNNITQQLWSKCDLSTNNQSFLLSVKITSVAPCMTQCMLINFYLSWYS